MGGGGGLEMPSFLEVNEMRIPVSIDSPERFPEERGLKADSWMGKPLRVITKRVDRFQVETSTLTEYDGDMFYEILQGRGHFYPFSVDLYSCKGLSPFVWGDYNMTTGHHNGGVQLISETGFIVPQSDWSISFWFDNGTFWDHYVVLSNGLIYENNTSGSLLPTGITLTDYLIKFTNVTISDLIILPCLVNESFIESRYNSTSSFSLLPHLKITGLMFSGVKIYTCDVINRTYVIFSRFGEYQRKGQTLLLEFIEV